MSLNPAFDPETTSYTATTANATNRITATAEDGAAVTLTVNGEAAENGSSIAWETGENNVTITVERGNARRIYTIEVTKS